MSRIGKKPISLPSGVKVSVAKDNTVKVEGPKGKLEYTAPQRFGIEVADKEININRPSDSSKDRMFQGTVRSLINNMVIGVTEGFTKELEIIGVGYKAQVQGKKVVLNLGYSHPIDYQIPEGITVQTPKPTEIVVSGIDKAKVGEVAAELRDFRKPEPYKGKGVRYKDEYVRKKAGKAVA